MNTIPVTLAALVVLSGTATAQDPKPAANSRQNPVRLDRTGMNWVLPFKNALAVAKQNKRLLMIKPVAFGTEASGGW